MVKSSCSADKACGGVRARPFPLSFPRPAHIPTAVVRPPMERDTSMPSRTMKTGLFAALLACAGALLAACSSGPRAVRGSDEPGVDHAAMSTGLDRRDLQQMMNENMQAMRRSAEVQRWMQGGRPAVAVLPIQNETTEHIESALNALLSDI